MGKSDNRLVEWAIDQAQTRYKEEISILLEHNTYCLDEDRSVRYVNTIISDSKVRTGLARTFIINGIGYDFNQVSWESFERDAEAKGFWYTQSTRDPNRRVWATCAYYITIREAMVRHEGFRINASE